MNAAAVPGCEFVSSQITPDGMDAQLSGHPKKAGLIVAFHHLTAHRNVALPEAINYQQLPLGNKVTPLQCARTLNEVIGLLTRIAPIRSKRTNRGPSAGQAGTYAG